MTVYRQFTTIVFILLSGFLYSQKFTTTNKSLATRFSKENTTYLIDELIDLKGDTLYIGSNSTLEFGKGKFCNGIVKVDANSLDIKGAKGILENIVLFPIQKLNNQVKTKLKTIDASWFGTYGDNNHDDTRFLQNAIESAHNLGVPLFIERGNYKITSPLVLCDHDEIIGASDNVVDLANQRVHTVIRYQGKDKNIVNVCGKFVRISNLMLAANNYYVCDGIKSVGTTLGLCLQNVSIGNTRNALSFELQEFGGLSLCEFDHLYVSNSEKGINVNSSDKGSSYITYNQFNHLYFTQIKEKGVYMFASSINSTAFRDCLFANIGYGDAFDKMLHNKEIYSIEVHSQKVQGNITVQGGYFENQYYSQDGSLIQSFDYDNNAVFSVENINISLSDVRFANTRTIIRSKGNDCIKISNCIDNGALFSSVKKGYICNENESTILDIDGYCFSNADKQILKKSSLKSLLLASLTVKNFRLSDGKISKDIIFRKETNDNEMLLSSMMDYSWSNFLMFTILLCGYFICRKHKLVKKK